MQYSFLFAIFIVLLILKIAHVIVISWWLVTLPLWMPVLLVLSGLFIVAGFVGFIIMVAAILA